MNDYVTYVLVWFVAGWMLQGWWLRRKHDAWMKNHAGPDPDFPAKIAREVQTAVLLRIAKDTDLLERLQSDLQFLHDGMYRTIPHPADCPVCLATRRQLDDLIQSLRSVKLNVQAE